MNEEKGEKPHSGAPESGTPADRRDWRKNPPRCPYCRAAAQLVTGAAIYPDRPDLTRRRFWACVPCKAWCGVHENSPRCAPLGTLADAELRGQRRQVHDLLDPLWRGGGMSRQDAYAWLAKRLGMNVRRCHVGYFRDVQCMAAIAILLQRQGRRS